MEKIKKVYGIILQKISYNIVQAYNIKHVKNLTQIKKYVIILKMSLEGGIFIKRNSNEKASLSILKVSIISLILVFALGIGVRAVNTEISSVKIVLSNNYELNILTNKTSVREILEDNHIIVLEDEKVVPSLDEQISEDKTIVITGKSSA